MAGRWSQIRLFVPLPWRRSSKFFRFWACVFICVNMCACVWHTAIHIGNIRWSVVYTASCIEEPASHLWYVTGLRLPFFILLSVCGGSSCLTDAYRYHFDGCGYWQSQAGFSCVVIWQPCCVSVRQVIRIDLAASWILNAKLRNVGRGVNMTVLVLLLLLWTPREVVSKVTMK